MNKRENIWKMVNSLYKCLPQYNEFISSSLNNNYFQMKITRSQKINGVSNYGSDDDIGRFVYDFIEDMLSRLNMMEYKYDVIDAFLHQEDIISDNNEETCYTFNIGEFIDYAEKKDYLIDKTESNLIQIIDDVRNSYRFSMARIFPLASGNCGTFALAFSRLLNEANIQHNFIILSRSYYDNSHITAQEAIENSIDGDHIFICINDKYYDGSGIRTIEHLNDFYSSYNGKDNKLNAYSIVDNDMDSMRKYIKQFTTPLLTEEEIWSRISEVQDIYEIKPKISQSDMELLKNLGI